VRAITAVEESEKAGKRSSMYIKVGKLMDKSVILNLLKAVPTSDLEGLKSICARTVPHRATKKRERRWGGICGQHAGYCDEGTSIVWIYLWGITQAVFKEFTYGHSNLYDLFIERLAGTLYHEIGHHVHSKTKEYKVLEAQMTKLKVKLRRPKTKTITLLDGEKIHVYTDEYEEIKRKYNCLKDKVEDFAEKYAEATMEKAREMNLLEGPPPKDIRFFKIMRDKFIVSWLRHRTEMQREGHERWIGWPVILGVFDHLRKCKLGPHVKYNLREMFVEIYGNQPEGNKQRLFKMIAFAHLKPFWHVSKRGRKYAYFTKAQMNNLKRRLRGLPGEPSWTFRQLQLDSWLAETSVISEPWMRQENPVPARQHEHKLLLEG
jgi:hypothetical protein